jgi:formylglycine-generating enzyme required for sulfatase activity
MMAVPVTRAMYAAMATSQTDLERPDHPGGGVSWDDAMKFCRWLAEEQGFEGARLPTEEEWEYACRAGTNTRYWKGDSESDLAEVGWYGEGAQGSTHPVGEKQANPWGLYDVHGNVWEWTVSPWKGDYSGQADGIAIDPTAPPADLAGASPRVGRVIRSGSYWDGARDARAAYRYWGVPRVRCVNFGFRVLLPFAPSELR